MHSHKTPWAKKSLNQYPIKIPLSYKDVHEPTHTVQSNFNILVHVSH